MAKKRRESATVRTAKMLAIILDEPQDNPEDPGEVRMEQARRLLTNWSSAQGSLMGALAEIIKLKAGLCVRCEGDPCPACGWDSSMRLVP